MKPRVPAPSSPPPAAATSRWVRAAPALLAAASLYYVGAYLWVALGRAAYPYELEWLEGGMLEHVLQLLSGRPLYAAPSLQFTAMNYPPLYYWAAAPFVAALGESLLALRMVSILASLALFGLLFGLVRAETGRSSLGLLACGLFAAAYRLGGSWLDVGRSDSLYLALMMGGVAALRLDPAPRRSGLIAGALLTLAFLAKQSAVAVAAPIVLWQLVADRRRGLPLALATVAGVAGSVAILQAATGGWFSFYVFHVAGRHPAHPEWFWRIGWNDLLRPMAPALLVAAPVAGDAWRAGRAGWFPIAFAAGFAGSAWVLRLYPGTYDNVLLPAYLAFAVLASIGLNSWLARPGRAGRVGIGVAVALLAIQLAALAWVPGSQIPGPADRTQGDVLVRRLRDAPGAVFVPSHGYLTRRAGKPPHVHFMSLLDVLNAGRDDAGRGLWGALLDSLDAHAWSTILVDRDNWLMEEAVRAGYRPVAAAFPDTTSFFTVTGNRVRPEIVLLAP